MGNHQFPAFLGHDPSSVMRMIPCICLSTLPYSLPAKTSDTNIIRCQNAVSNYSLSTFAPPGPPGRGADPDPDASPVAVPAAGSASCGPGPSTLASNSSIFFSSCVSWLSIADAVFSPLLRNKVPHKCQRDRPSQQSIAHKDKIFRWSACSAKWKWGSTD